MQRFDDALTRKVQSLPKSWRWYFNQMTLLGQPIFALLSAAAISYYGEYSESWQLMLAGMIVAATLLAASGLKFVLRRQRPPTEYAAAMFIKTYSFPSGHAAASTSCYGLVLYLMLISQEPLLIVTAIALVPVVLSIGISRIYLGAHYPSDIIAGWIFGLMGLAVAAWVLTL